MRPVDFGEVALPLARISKLVPSGGGTLIFYDEAGESASHFIALPYERAVALWLRTLYGSADTTVPASP
ncbi:hypothetical protein [Caldimonas tepidiphila]|uniref:hypothetical protein n=1 Tax=Caldimonas tepidiphila TaxID=2315841 RepID=UPI000E5A1A58|nr:hypothetical protein [Caldimonas tepidiphila]